MLLTSNPQMCLVARWLDLVGRKLKRWRVVGEWRENGFTMKYRVGRVRILTRRRTYEGFKDGLIGLFCLVGVRELSLGLVIEFGEVWRVYRGFYRTELVFE